MRNLCILYAWKWSIPWRGALLREMEAFKAIFLGRPLLLFLAWYMTLRSLYSEGFFSSSVEPLTGLIHESEFTAFGFWSTPFLSWLSVLWSTFHLFLGFVLLWWELCLQAWSDKNSVIMLSNCQGEFGFMFLDFVESPDESRCLIVEIQPSGINSSAQLNVAT